MYLSEMKCPQCGKLFCLPFKDRWAYKCITKNNQPKYFCKYTCMLHYQEEHQTKKKPVESENCSEKKQTNKWYQNNREKAIANSKAYYHAHKDEPEFKQKRKDSFYRWREKNRDYYQKHKKQQDEITKRWIANNRDRWNAYQREYKRKKKLEVRNESSID